jgi:hypothetical protein
MSLPPRELVQTAARVASSKGLDPVLVCAVIAQESAWDPRAYRFEPHINEASYGLMQVLESTARWMGLTGDVERLYDPETGITVGCDYLVWLRNFYKNDGDVRKMLGGYNAGPSNWQIATAYIESVLIKLPYYRNLLAQYSETPMERIVPRNGTWPVSQVYGVNPEAYAKFGLNGHNGEDYAIVTGTKLHAIQAMDMVEVAYDDMGYGLYVKGIVADEQFPEDTGRHWLFAHGLIDGPSGGWQTFVAPGQHVEAGQLLMLSDNTGNSTGPHLHLATRNPVHDRGDGMLGYEDPAPVLARIQAVLTPEPTEPPPPWDGLWRELVGQRDALAAEVSGLNGTTAELRAQVANWQAESDFNRRKMLVLLDYLYQLERSRRVKKGTADGLLAGVTR